LQPLNHHNNNNNNNNTNNTNTTTTTNNNNNNKLHFFRADLVVILVSLISALINIKHSTWAILLPIKLLRYVWPNFFELL